MTTRRDDHHHGHGHHHHHPHPHPHPHPAPEEEAEAGADGLTRFSVSLSGSLAAAFDGRLRAVGYPTRSKAVGDLIREFLARASWSGGQEAAGAIVLVYDHHRAGLSQRLVRVQHEFSGLVLSTQHLHLDGDNCLEIVAVRGAGADIEALADRLRATKGVKCCTLAVSSTGRGLPAR